MRLRFSPHFWFVAAYAAATVSASAIVIRHDVPDEKYLQLGAKFPAVGRVLPDGVATLIAPQWALTAAHVAQELSPFCGAVRFGERTVPVEYVCLHSAWKGRPRPGSPDVALLHLATPVADIPPVELNSRDDEAGQIITFVGNGMTGHGRSGPVSEDRKWRAATNRIEEADADWVRFRFDPPRSATPLEGISGPGDSGGPALFERDGRWSILGISSSNNNPEGLEPCTYNTIEIYARVSTAREWIESAMKSPSPSTAWDRPVDLSGGEWPATPAAVIGRAFVESFNEQSDDAMREFEKSHRAAAVLAMRSVEARVETWRESRGKWGRLTPRRCAANGPLRLALLIDTEKREPQSLVFDLEQTAPHKLRGIVIGEATANR